MADESVEEILEKKEAGEKLTVQEAGKLGGKAYKAQERAKEVGERDTVEDILEKKEAGEPLTAKERGILGGTSYKKVAEARGDNE
eukprot:m51a1_g8111 hypothetical protein (85) ;mRNA; f:128262-128583